jgi:hypothetical protein
MSLEHPDAELARAIPIGDADGGDIQAGEHSDRNADDSSESENDQPEPRFAGLNETEIGLVNLLEWRRHYHFVCGLGIWVLITSLALLLVGGGRASIFRITSIGGLGDDDDGGGVSPGLRCVANVALLFMMNGVFLCNAMDCYLVTAVEKWRPGSVAADVILNILPTVPVSIVRSGVMGWADILLPFILDVGLFLPIALMGRSDRDSMDVLLMPMIMIPIIGSLVYTDVRHKSISAVVGVFRVICCVAGSVFGVAITVVLVVACY